MKNAVSNIRRIDPRSFWRRSIPTVVLAALIGGCSSYQHWGTECCTDQIFGGWRDHVWAKRAYHQRFPVCSCLHPSHFRRGFMAGYDAICCGEDGYVPAMPPRDYWGYAYQSAEGQQMVNAWYEGYPEGVKAAQEDGAGQFRDIQVSRMLDAALQPPNPDFWQTSAVEGDAQPPVISGQDLTLPPMPTESSDIPTSGAPVERQLQDTSRIGRQAADRIATNTPMPVEGQRVSWDEGR